MQIPEGHIGFEVRTLSNLISRKINQMTTEEESSCPTPSQIWVLKYLACHQGQDVMQKDLEKQLSIRRSTTSHMLQIMERDGYIQRVPVPEDARLKKIVPTEKGLETHKRMIDRLLRFEALLQSGLDKDELQQFLRTLKKLEQNLEE